jgi:hypothetical protein
MKTLLIAVTLLFATLSAQAGVLKFSYKHAVKPAAHHVKHCGPKVVKKAAKVASYKVVVLGNMLCKLLEQLIFAVAAYFVALAVYCGVGGALNLVIGGTASIGCAWLERHWYFND